MRPQSAVWIDVLPQGIYRRAECDALVFVDVMLAGTTAITSLAQGRRTFFPAGLAQAREIGKRFPGAILAQEDVAGARDFVSIGPTAITRGDAGQPLVLVTSWSHLLAEAAGQAAVYLAGLGNLSATAAALAATHSRVALLCAGFGGEQRSEDRITAAKLAEALVSRGFDFGDLGTAQEMQSWARADLSLLGWGKSAEYLRRLGQEEDLAFVLSHDDDLSVVCVYERGELVRFDQRHRPAQVGGVGASFAQPARTAAAGQRSHMLSLAGAVARRPAPEPEG